MINKEFRCLLDKTVKILKMKDDDMTFYYLSFFHDENFLEYLQKLYQLDFVECSDILCDAVEHGYCVRDLKNSLSLITQTEFPEEFSICPLKREFVQSCNAVHPQETIKKDNDEVDFFRLELSYHTSENNVGDCQNSIEFYSNIIPSFVALEIIRDILGLQAIYDIHDDIVQLEVDEMIDKVDDYFNEEAMENFERKYYQDNHLILKLNKNTGFDFYYLLRHRMEGCFDVIETENIFIHIRKFLKNLPHEFYEISLKKIINNSMVYDFCSKLGLNVLGDLFKKIPNEMKQFEANCIFENLQKMDTSLPNVQWERIINKFNGPLTVVLRDRYLLEESMTLDEIGQRYNCTRERIRQLEKKAISVLKTNSKMRLVYKFYLSLKKFSKSDFFITEEEIKKLNLSKGILILLDKVLNRSGWSQVYGVYFFLDNTEQDLEREIQELPQSFTTDKLEQFADNIAEFIDVEIPSIEIQTLIKRRYRVVGNIITKGRLQLRDVLTYLIKKYYPQGFDPYDPKNLDFLREKAKSDLEGYELSDSDHAIHARLQSICIAIGRGFWKIDDTDTNRIPDDLKEMIIQYIQKYPIAVVPIQSILNEFQTQLCDLDINNRYFLHELLKKFLPVGYEIGRDYIFKDKTQSIYTIIEEFILKSKTPVTKYDIFKAIPGVSEGAVQLAVLNSNVLNMNGYYVHLDNLHITQSEILILQNSLSETITEKIIYHSKSVYQKIRNNNLGLFSRIGINHYLQFLSLIKILFPNHYEYQRPFIALKGVTIENGETQLLNKLEKITEMPISEIREMASEVGVIIDRYIDLINENNDAFVFKNHNQIISLEYAGINDDKFHELDNILDIFMQGKDYRALNEFLHYEQLPELNCPWNEWILYSIIGKYSIRYKTVTSSKKLSQAIPFIVCKDYDENTIDFSQISYEEFEGADFSYDDDSLIDLLDFDDFE